MYYNLNLKIKLLNWIHETINLKTSQIETNHVNDRIKKNELKLQVIAIKIIIKTIKLFH